MQLRISVDAESPTSPLFAEAFYKGVCGETYTLGYSQKYDGSTDWAGFATPRNWFEIQLCREKGYNFYYGDHAYFGRNHFYRITKNAFQHNGIGKSDCKRFLWHGIEIKPWKRGRDIIICPQSDIFFLLRGIDKADWIEKTISEISRFSDRKIIIHEKRNQIALKKLMPDAHCVIVHSSNAAVEAVLSGVPAICLGHCAASLMSVASISRIEDLYFPENRLEWAGVLADNQWTFDEIESGAAWKVLNETI